MYSFCVVAQRICSGAKGWYARFTDRGYLEEDGALQDAGRAAHLSNGVHGELWGSDVRHGEAEAGGQDGSNGGPTRAIVTHHHILREEDLFKMKTTTPSY